VTPPFFLAAAGGTQSIQGSGTISYVLGSASASAASLLAVDPDGGVQTTTVASSGTWSELARFSQWTPATAGAGSWGPRFIVYADSGNALNLVDLLVPGSAQRPAPPPAGGSVLPGGLAVSNVCSDVTAINDFANAANSLVVFRNPGTTPLQDCGSADDQFYTVVLAGGTQPGSTTTASLLSLVEPVDAVRDANGAITKLLSIVHPANYTSTGAPATPPTLQVSLPSLSGAVGIGTPNANGVNGTGTNAGGSRDFQSLGVVNVGMASWWFYRDLASIMVASVSAGSPVAVDAYPGAGASLGAPQAPAWFDANNAYVAINGPGQGAIVAIQLASLTSTPVVTVLAPETANVNIAGITGSAVIYWLADGSAVKSVPIAGGAATTLSTNAIGAGMTLSAIYGVAPPVVVSSGSNSGVYFTVCECVGYSSVPQAWFSSGTGNPTRIGGSTMGAMVLGGFVAAATPVGRAATPAYAGAVVATTVGALATAPMGFSFLGSGLVEYGANGAAGVTYGALGVSAGSGVVFDTGGLSPGVAQSGMPFLFLGSGSDGNGNPAQDLWKFLPGTSGLTRLTTRLQ
jgi:hypothetical protein